MACEYNGNPGSEHYNISPSVNNPVNQATDVATGLSIYLQNEIYMYPNPANDKIYIIAPEKSEIEISTIEGQKIESIITKNSVTSVDIYGFAKGMYFINVKTCLPDRQAEDGIFMKKFIKE